jgi:hypothetical protein
MELRTFDRMALQREGTEFDQQKVGRKDVKQRRLTLESAHFELMTKKACLSSVAVRVKKFAQLLLLWW